MPLTVFCTTAIPEETFDRFLEGAEEYGDIYNTEYGYEETLEKTMSVVVSKDPKKFTILTTRPFPAFNSPFIGDTVQTVARWFTENLHAARVQKFSFLVLDEQTVKDNATCLLVVFGDDEYEPMQTLRCDFSSPYREALDCEYQPAPWDCDWRGIFVRSNIVLTQENRDEAIDGRFQPIVNGVFEMVEEFYRDPEEPPLITEVLSTHGALLP